MPKPLDGVDMLDRWASSPLTFVSECLGITPDAWQAKALNAIVPHGTTRLALKACAGPGKSALLAWAGWWFLLTQGEKGEHPKGIAVSITGDNLRDNLWAEMSKWQQRSPLLLALFQWQSERIFCKEHPHTWFLSARAFAKSATAEVQANTLAGLHSKYCFYLVDESGEMVPAIGRAVEQGLGPAAVGMAIQAGNPTSLSGLLAESARTGWNTVTITSDPDDPDRTPRVPIKWAREQIEQYGRENPWVMARILGKFPPGGLNTLIGLEEAQTASRRSYLEGTFMHAPKVIGVDVARFGDDTTVIIRRQGMMAWQPIVLRKLDTTTIGDRVAFEINEWGPDAVFIDTTGGYGGGVLDYLRLLGHKIIHPVEFASSPHDPRFFNKRMEIWWEMAQWVKKEGAVPPGQQLQDDLTNPRYGFQGGRMILESKEDMKKRGLPSPDIADALACTFSATVIPAKLADAMHAGSQDFAEKQARRFDPFRGLRKRT